MLSIWQAHLNNLVGKRVSSCNLLINHGYQIYKYIILAFIIKETITQLKIDQLTGEKPSIRP